MDEALLHIIRGDLLICLGDLRAAQASFQKAIDIARRQSAKTIELRAASSLARLWRDQGKRAEARELLAAIYGCSPKGSTRRSYRRRNRSLTNLVEEARVSPATWGGKK